MQKLVRRFTTYALLALGSCLLSVIAFTNPTLSVTLDTKGDGAFPCTYNQCSVKSAMVKLNTTDKITYEFNGNCTTTQEGCRNMDMFATGEWDRKTKIATETIGEPVSKGVVIWKGGGSKSSCSDNPWINKNAACAPFNFMERIPGPYPVTARLLNDSQRQSLKQQEQAQLILPTPQAPVIDLPPANKMYLTPAKIPLKVQQNTAYNVVFEFQRASLISKPNIPHIYASHPVTPDNLKTYAGVTTGELNINETGKWRFRAQCNFPGAPWSEWRVFIVDTLTKIPSIETK
jgi:hypothetical protein